MLYLHELGHYVCAKKDKIYRGWGLVPTPHIKMSKPYSKRIYYLSGLIGSLFSLPFYYLTSYNKLWFFFVIITSISLLDIYIFFCPKKLYLIEEDSH